MFIQIRARIQFKQKSKNEKTNNTLINLLLNKVPGLVNTIILFFFIPVTSNLDDCANFGKK